jgi:acetyl esterase
MSETLGLPAARPLAPGMADFIRQCVAVFPARSERFSVAEQRAMYRELCRRFATPRPPGVSVRDAGLPAGDREIPIRIYRPAGEGRACLLYFHGGGYVLGDLDGYDSIAAELAACAGVTVIAVDYRLAPEHPYPAAFEDCAAALDVVSAEAARLRIDPARLGVGGDSAGGNLSAALSLRARALGGPPLIAQVLIYPDLGLRHDPELYVAGEDSPLLSGDEIGFYDTAYLGPTGTTTDPYAAPLLARDYGDLPPAVILAAAHDPLCADARVYAERLKTAGVAAELHVAPGLVHGWLRARHECAEAAQVFGLLCAATKRLLRAETELGKTRQSR